MMNHTGYEVTTYRIDGDYSDGRHPEQVTFTDNLVEDLKRRDFTINAMAYNDRAGLVDEFDGIGDLENQVIRCVGNPLDRFGEDALRMLRAVRFSSQLGFSIDDAISLSSLEAMPEDERWARVLPIETVFKSWKKVVLPDFFAKLASAGLEIYLKKIGEEFPLGERVRLYKKDGFLIRLFLLLLTLS
jgi:tRNA nucleotidyltransferase/poly(A) polymerase